MFRPGRCDRQGTSRGRAVGLGGHGSVAVDRAAAAGHQHGPCSPGPARAREAATAAAARRHGHRPVTADRAERALVCRRQRRVHPSAAESVREGLEETLTILSLGLSDSLRRSLSTTNAVESLISRTRHVKRNVKRWRGGPMVLRWVAAGVLEAVKGFRRVKGHKEMPTLITALRARDQQLGLVGKDAEKVAESSIEPPLKFNSERDNSFFPDARLGIVRCLCQEWKRAGRIRLPRDVQKC
jgi:hypothetical protein